jgi:hypothetical protein
MLYVLLQRSHTDIITTGYTNCVSHACLEKAGRNQDAVKLLCALSLLSLSLLSLSISLSPSLSLSLSLRN